LNSPISSSKNWIDGSAVTKPDGKTEPVWFDAVIASAKGDSARIQRQRRAQTTGS
jgi:hypothetical protein